MNEKLVARRAETKAFLQAFKEMVGCKDCGTTEGRLDFDHRDKSTKAFGVGSGLHRSWASLLAEMEKCDVRCRSCHMGRHHREDSNFLPPPPRFGFLSHCRRGHELTPENTYVAPGNKKRACKICRRELDRRRTARNRAEKQARAAEERISA